MLKTASIAAALVLALPACKSDKEGDGGGAAKTSAKTGKGDVASFITGTAPALPAEVAALTFGQPEADALKAVGATSGYVPSKANDKVSYNLRFTKDKKLDQISVQADEDLTPLLTKQWGEPIKTDKESFWFNPATGTRAWLPDYGKGKTVTFSAYEPVEKILGEKGELAFAAGKPLLGATIDELHAAWKAKLCDFDERGAELKKAFADAEKDLLVQIRDHRPQLRYCADLPRTVDTTAPYGDEFRFGDDGRVASMYLTFKVNKSPAMMKQLLETIDKTFGGKPVEVKTKYGTDRYYFDPTAKIRAKVTVSEQSVGLEYSKYLPVAELIGGDKPGLSIEGAHMPVGTHAEIKADDPLHFKQRGESAYLYYPATEYGYRNTEVELEQYASDRKTYGYRVVLHHTDNEAAGDQVFELLKAKFGEPKQDKKSTDKDVYYNFTKNGRKVSARRVSEQWQITVTK